MSFNSDYGGFLAVFLIDSFGEVITGCWGYSGLETLMVFLFFGEPKGLTGRGGDYLKAVPDLAVAFVTWPALGDALEEIMHLVAIAVAPGIAPKYLLSIDLLASYYFLIIEGPANEF